MGLTIGENAWEPMHICREGVDPMPIESIEAWINTFYRVEVFRDGAEIIRCLKIYAADEVYDPGNGDMRFRHNWEHMQQIKNDIAGEDAECFEVYPAQSRVVNTDNVYWLFVMPPGQRLPVGICADGLGGRAMRPVWHK